MLLFLLTIVGASALSNTPINSGSGLYFDPLSDMKITQRTWNVVTYVDLNSVNEELNLISKGVANLTYRCFEIMEGSAKPTCTKHLNSLRLLMEEMYVKEKNLEHISTKSRRTKRGLINGLGKVFKAITGNLDSDDAEYYDKAISEIHDGERQLANLMDEQTHIIREALEKVNKSIEQTNTNNNIMIKGMERIDEILSEVRTKVTNEELEIIFIEQIDISTVSMIRLNNKIDMITEATLLASKDILHPNILSPSTLARDLKNHLNNLPYGHELPVSPRVENIAALLGVINLVVYVINNRLIYVIQIPLAGKTTYKMYKVYPLPINHANTSDTYSLIMPEHQYLAISEDKQTYASMNNMNDYCKQIVGRLTICKGINIMSTHQDMSCESMIIQKRTNKIPESCNLRTIYGHIELWQRLSSNRWLYTTSTMHALRIECRNEKTTEITIEKTGMLTLDKGCRAENGLTQLVADDPIIIEEQPSLTMSNLINDECCPIEELKTIRLKVPPIKLVNIATHDNMRAKIEKFHSEIIDFNKQTKVVRQTTVFEIIVYISIVISICIVITIVVLKVKQILKKSNVMTNRAIEPGQELDGI